VGGVDDVMIAGRICIRNMNSGTVNLYDDDDDDDDYDDDYDYLIVSRFPSLLPQRIVMLSLLV